MNWEATATHNTETLLEVISMTFWTTRAYGDNDNFLITQSSFQVPHTQKFNTFFSVAYKWTKGWQAMLCQG